MTVEISVFHFMWSADIFFAVRRDSNIMTSKH